MTEMIKLIGVLLAIIIIGLSIYLTRYKGKEKPKVNIKRINPNEYFKDYWNLKLYWTSIFFMIFGIVILIAILIIELTFNF